MLPRQGSAWANPHADQEQGGCQTKGHALIVDIAKNFLYPEAVAHYYIRLPWIENPAEVSRDLFNLRDDCAHPNFIHYHRPG